MKKSLLERAEKFAESTHAPYQVYFDRKVPDARYKADRYFFKFYNTNTVLMSFRNQKQLDHYLTIKGF